MLQTSHLPTKSAIDLKSIAGQYGGRKVVCTPSALNVYNNLKKLADNGNYWAGLVVRGIAGLASGRLNNENIFIEEKFGLAYGKGAFHIVLPGVTASLEEHTNGQYILQYLNADLNYLDMQKNAEEPGLWKVSSKKDDSPVFVSNGEIANQEFRPVVISDMAKSDPTEIAYVVRDDLTEVNGTLKKMVESKGFDLHHTPGKKGIVGLKKAKDALSTEKDRKITKSATLLANTMYQARNIEGVMWYSDWGGSAVLNRALEIIHSEKNITLEKHSIFLNRPTCNTIKTLKLAEKVGILPLSDGSHKTGISSAEIRGRIFEVKGSRVAKLTGASITAAGTGFGIAGVAALSGPALPIAGAIATFAGFYGGLKSVGEAVFKAKKALKQKQYK